MKRRSIWAVAMTGLLVGCATLTSPLESGGEKRLQEGLQALGRGDYRLAHERLSWVAQRYGHEQVGQQAVLTLAALELDPRNPGRRINVGSDMAATYLKLPEKAAWTHPVAQTLYLLGLELSAEQRADTAEKRLPTLPGPSVSARIRTAQQERDRMEQERDRLARRVESLEKQLSEKEQELQRIRKTIRP